MNIFSIFNRKLPLPIGVEIRYEEHDAEHVMHFLYFLETYMKQEKKGTIVLIPAITANGNKADSAKLIKEFEKFNEGERRINGHISFCFLDEMRSLFKEYLETLEKIKKSAEANFDWTAEHEFFVYYLYFKEIERKYFPSLTAMH